MDSYLGNQLKDRNKVIDLLIKDHKMDYDSAITWINSVNFNFGLSTPETLIQAGKTDKIILFLEAVKQGY